ncbi:MAG TPA: PEGA domain-containing protein, partial [Polyangia bacterium]|nr:PEGA domain-containing protein [Polyangia bacterium]
APAVGSDPFGTRGAAPTGVASESSGAFGRPRSTTGMNAMRPAPAPSSLFEKPSAEDIDRALSVLTEVDGPAPAPAPTPVDFSARVRKPTDAQPMVLESMPEVGSAPKPAHRRLTDAQPMVLESMPDVGAPARPKTGTQPLFSGPGAATGETRAQTVPVVPLGELSEEPLHDEEEEDDATSAWVGSGPTRVGDQDVPAAAKGPKLDDALAQAPTVVAKLGEGKLGEAKPSEAKPSEAKASEAKPSEAKPGVTKPAEAPPRRPSSPSLPAAAQPPAPPSLDAAASRSAAPKAAPAIMAPNFAAETLPAKKKSSGGKFGVFVVILLAIAGGGAWYFVKGPGRAMLAKNGMGPASAPPEGTAPAPTGAAPSEPEKAAAEQPVNAEAKTREAKPAEAKPAEAKPAEAKPAEAKGEGKPSEVKPAEAKGEEKPSEAKSEAKPHKGKRRGGGASEPAAEAKPAAAAAVADVSPKPSEGAAKPEGEAKPASDAAGEAAKPAGGGHVLKITSSPAGAEVIVDGTSMGTTPFSSGDIDPALPHSVTIKKDGFESYEHMIGGSDWPRPKGGVRTLKLNAKLRSTGGEAAKPAESDTPSGEPPPGLGTTPASPKRE